MLVVCLGLGLGLSLLTFRLGYVLDDYMQLANTEGVLLPSRPLDQFTFVRTPEQAHAYVDRGPLPWWTLPELRLSFFRPLSSALIAFDHTVFKHTVWLHHAHSALWFLLLIFAASRLYQRALPEGAAALALLLFTLDDAHMMPVGWLANRNALVAAVPCVLGLTAYVRFREEGWQPGKWLAALGIAVGLTGAEAALGYVGYLVMYERFGKRGLGNAVRALAPVFAVLLAWAVLYRAFGFGAYGSASYVDPGHDPIQFLKVAGPRLLALLGALTLKVTSDLWLLKPAVRPFLVVAGLVGSGLVVTALASLWRDFTEAERHAVRWLSSGAVLALVPGLATFPLDRMLLAASLGGLAVFALMIRAAWRRTKKSLLILGWLGALHLALPPFGWVISSTILDRYARASEASVFSEPTARFTGRVVLLTVSDPSPAVYGTLFLHTAGRPAPERWWTLSMSPKGHRLTRVGDRALELEVIDGLMIDTVFEQLMRGDGFPFEPGQVVALDGLRITVLASTGGRPSKIRADFELPLEDHKLLVWNKGRFDQIQAPALGSALDIPAAPALFERAFTSD